MKNYQFYHIYPLGMLGFGKRKLDELNQWIPYWKEMNSNGIYLGPVFQSCSHGYDTIDYKSVDERLGSNLMLRDFIFHCHQQGISVIIDCVFNHVSRDFFAFRDLLIHRQNSKYASWFFVDFTTNNHRNDGFTYSDWAGHDELVKLNLKNQEVKNYLHEVLGFWMDYFDIDGLRFDAADVMDRGFLRELITEARNKKSEFYCVGEIVHGDYQGFLQESDMDSVTNYEVYKGLYSSLNDQNYFEIAYSMKRLFGRQGILSNSLQYNFVDNHDVHRAASVLNDPSMLYPLYLMLYTIKGYPSLYYGSELAMEGKRTHHSDLELRKELSLDEVNKHRNHPLRNMIIRLSSIRKEHSLLAHGEYEELFVDHQLIIYRRFHQGCSIVVMINQSKTERKISNAKMVKWCGEYQLDGWDLLEQESIANHGAEVVVHPNWGRIVI